MAGGPEANGAAPTVDARDVVRRALTADRAEAQAQLEMARDMLASVTPPPDPPLPSLPTPPGEDLESDLPVAAEELRRAAAAAREAMGLVTKTEVRLTGRPPIDEGLLEAAVHAKAEADAARTEIAPAWRRTAGALISATGMAIIVASLSWPPWTYLIPTALVLVMAADLRMAAAAARTASLHAAEAMAAAGVASVEGVARARAEEVERQVARRRLDEARRMAAEAAAYWDQLAPGTPASDVEALISRLRSAAFTPRPPPPEPPAEHRPLTPAQERTRALAEALVAEARREIARVEAALAELATYDGKPAGG